MSPGTEARPSLPTREEIRFARQLTTAGWVLGFLAGPLPAIAIVVIVSPTGWVRRHLVAAAVFWTLLGVGWYMLVAAALTGPRPDPVDWLMWAVVGLIGAAFGVRASVVRARQDAHAASAAEERGGRRMDHPNGG